MWSQKGSKVQIETMVSIPKRKIIKMIEMT